MGQPSMAPEGELAWRVEFLREASRMLTEPVSAPTVRHTGR